MHLWSAVFSQKFQICKKTVSKQLRLRCFTLCVHGDKERVESFEITQEARLALGDASSNFPAVLKTSRISAMSACQRMNQMLIQSDSMVN